MVKKVVKKTVTETTDDEGNKKTVVKEHAPKIIDGTHKPRKPRKKMSSEDKAKRMTAREREDLLIENFVGLQHAMTNMSVKFGMLSDNMSKLLGVFEEAAKGFVVGDKTDDKDMLNKIDSLLDQNKTIAKGLVLMEDKVRTRVDQTEDAEKTLAEAESLIPKVKQREDENSSKAPNARPPENQRPPAPNFPVRPKPLPRI